MSNFSKHFISINYPKMFRFYTYKCRITGPCSTCFSSVLVEYTELSILASDDMRSQFTATQPINQFSGNHLSKRPPFTSFSILRFYLNLNVGHISQKKNCNVNSRTLLLYGRMTMYHNFFFISYKWCNCYSLNLGI